MDRTSTPSDGPGASPPRSASRARSGRPLRRSGHAVGRPLAVARPFAAAATLAVALLTGCDIPDFLEDPLGTRTPHERYRDALVEAGLEGSALAARWIAAADSSLAMAETVPLPHREAGFFAADAPRAAAWRVPLRRGRRLVVEVEVRGLGRPRVFLDAFRVEERFEHQASADSAGPGRPPTYRLTLAAEEDGEVVVRLQPELLRDVSYEAVLRTEPTLAFPVEGVDIEAIRSGYGAPREAGRRIHEGVDIFAPRGTPVLAAADGRVSRVGTNRLGGRVVWLRPEGGLSLYHAHLDTALVEGGRRVAAGDTLGRVGNSGNARTTPPHLHFGVYDGRAGAVDPLPFLRPPAPTPPPVSAEPRWPEGRTRTAARARLRRAPTTEGEPVEVLPAHTILLPLATTGSWVRVEIPGRRRGWVHRSLLEEATEPIARASGPAGAPVRSDPHPDAALVRAPSDPWVAGVLGLVEGYRLLRMPDGVVGWSPREPS